MALFELADDQATPVEVAYRDDGRLVVRLRRDAAVTSSLLGELNELFADVPPAAVVARPPVVVVVVR